jgi:ribosomal protein S18 acetylase RimI-like enzyme
MKKLNENRNKFNPLNDNFFVSFSEKNLIQRLLLLRNVKLLKYNNDYVGCIWVERQQKAQYSIYSISFIDEYHASAGGSFLIKSLKTKGIFTYECESNSINVNLLQRFGFMREQGTIELKRDVKEQKESLVAQNISFECFVPGKHEKIRCEIQNNIFMDVSREPLTIDDIYFDIKQEYFLEEGSIFMKYKNEYIGYGQVILDDSIPTIVNFGILSDYRGKGYGKLLLNYLINLLHKMNFLQVKIRVYSDNYTALNLYISTGFEKIKEYHKWNLIK